jgi:hypothetical protein
MVHSISKFSPSLQASALAIIYFPKNDVLNKEFAKYTLQNEIKEHTMYYGYFIAKALGTFSKESQQQYIIQKYFECSKHFGTIFEKTEPESSLAHGWSVGVVEFLV